MAAKARSGGTQRVLQKLNKSIEDGEYYEAHQLIRTLYFRFVSFCVFDNYYKSMYKACHRKYNFLTSPIFLSFVKYSFAL